MALRTTVDLAFAEKKITSDCLERRSKTIVVSSEAKVIRILEVGNPFFRSKYEKSSIKIYTDSPK